MIIELKCENFYSIKDETIIDFTVTENNPKGGAYRMVGASELKRRASLLNVFIGPNASGKSNIVKSLAILKHLIVDSQADHDEIGIYYFSSHAKRMNEATKLGVKFSIDKKIFEYAFEFDHGRILSEELSEHSKTSDRFTEKKVFFRKWNEVRGAYDFRFYDERIKLMAKDLRKNASIISVAKQLPRYEFAQHIADYWDKNVMGNMQFGGAADTDIRRMGISYIDRVIDNETLKERVNTLLRSLDVGFDDIERREFKLGSGTFYNYYVNHKYDEESFATSWHDESSGTQRLFRILSMAAIVLSEKNATLFIDELDAQLHPDLSEAIVELFHDPDVNVNEAQLIFNTHNHRILTNLDKQQIFLVEKNGSGNTEVWRLDEVEGVRADDNYYTKYMAGAFAAKPRI